MDNKKTLSLIVPCYNEERTIASCIDRILAIRSNPQFDMNLELIVVDDDSKDNSYHILQKIAEEKPYITVLRHEKNKGKGAALRTGFLYAKGDFVGIQDADEEYDPLDYITMLEPILAGSADAVYGSRYLKLSTRRVLYFWHTWMNKHLTSLSNMFTNLDITDMETCYKLFRRNVIQEIAPTLKEERFGFEPEVTAKIAQGNYRVYECAISYTPRSFEEGKKIGWRDGFHALYCIFHYSAHTAPLPIQILIYLFIGGISLSVNVAAFVIATQCGINVDYAIVLAFFLASLCNYLLCITILFRHTARWKTVSEVLLYFFSVAIMGVFDFAATHFLINLIPFFGVHWSLAKFWSSLVGFIGNFALRKWIVFREKK